MSDVMLIGSGRSGTTFVQALFDSHPDTLCLHEPDSLYPVREPPFLPRPRDHAALAPVTAAYIARLKQVRGLRAVQKQMRVGKSYRGRLAGNARAGVLHLYRALDMALGRVLPVAKWPVPDFARKQAAAIVLKSVESVGRLALIAESCPQMRVVHILRHPCGVVASRLQGVKLGKMAAPRVFDDQLALPLARTAGLDAATRERWDGLEMAAWNWTLVNDAAMRASDGLANVQF
ncbi:MAG: sulfotransferase, partial [Alphaproteobacteria bacterium]